MLLYAKLFAADGVFGGDFDLAADELREIGEGHFELWAMNTRVSDEVYRDVPSAIHSLTLHDLRCIANAYAAGGLGWVKP